MQGQYNYQGDLPPEAAAGMMAFAFGMMIFMLILVLAIYIFYAVCLMKIAKKTGTPNGWFAWIPILNVVLMLQIAKKPIWFLILFLVPLANIIIMILVWMAIAKELKKPDWLGVLMIVPIANLIVPAYLAFSKDEATPVEEKVA